MSWTNRMERRYLRLWHPMPFFFLSRRGYMYIHLVLHSLDRFPKELSAQVSRVYSDSITVVVEWNLILNVAASCQPKTCKRVHVDHPRRLRSRRACKSALRSIQFRASEPQSQEILHPRAGFVEMVMV